jgi:DNA-binding LytR/AlgR family response regulator
MPGINGIEYIKSLKESPLIILTTAYPQFALEAFELDVLDYLLKPIRFERFFKAVNKCKEILHLQKQGKTEIENIEEDHFYIKADRKYVKLYFKDVLYIKGMKDYVMIFTNTNKYMTALNIKTIFAQLPKAIFARVSKSYLINVNQIDAIDIDSIMIGNEEVPLGNSYKEAFLKQHVKGKLFKR